VRSLRATKRPLSICAWGKFRALSPLRPQILPKSFAGRANASCSGVLSARTPASAAPSRRETTASLREAREESSHVRNDSTWFVSPATQIAKLARPLARRAPRAATPPLRWLRRRQHDLASAGERSEMLVQCDAVPARRWSSTREAVDVRSASYGPLSTRGPPGRSTMRRVGRVAPVRHGDQMWPRDDDAVIERVEPSPR